MMKKVPFLLIGMILFMGIFVFIATKNKEAPLTSLQKRFIQKEGTYTISFTDSVVNIQPESSRLFIFKIKDPDGQVLKNFDVVHEKLLHFIVIRHDLQYFQHLHPDYDPETGEFRVDVKFIAPGPYRLIAEFTPPKFEGNPNSLAVTALEDVSVGAVTRYKPQKIQLNQNNVMNSGEYAVTYHFPEKVKAGEEFTYSISIKRNGSDVAHIGEYLGALAHAIIFNSDTLESLHLHSNDHGSHSETSDQSDSMSSQIEFTAKIQQLGIYKMYTEFKHQEQVIVSDYTFQVE